MTFIQAATIETIHKITNNIAKLQKFDMRLYEKVENDTMKPKKLEAQRKGGDTYVRRRYQKID